MKSNEQLQGKSRTRWRDVIIHKRKYGKSRYKYKKSAYERRLCYKAYLGGI
jgi:hypothetical protein